MLNDQRMKTDRCFSLVDINFPLLHNIHHIAPYILYPLIVYIRHMANAERSELRAEFRQNLVLKITYIQRGLDLGFRVMHCQTRAQISHKLRNRKSIRF